MKMDSDSEITFSRSSSNSFHERPPDETDASSTAPALIHDDETSDYVFFQLSPPSGCETPLQPLEGSTDITGGNSGMTLSNGAADASSTKANPHSLDRHPGEKQLMTEQDKMDKMMLSKTQSSRKSLDNNDKSSTTHQGQTFMDGKANRVETSYDKPGKHYEDYSSEDEDSNDGQEIVLSEEDENWEENHRNRESFSQQIPPNAGENLESETCPSKEGDKTNSEDECFHEDIKISRDQLDSKNIETSAPALSGPANEDEFETPGLSVSCRFSQNTMENATSLLHMDKLSGEMTSAIEEHADRSLDCNLTISDRLKRESGTVQTQTAQLFICKDSEDIADQRDESWRIATDIHQGEQLLHRLQMVQLRHDEIPNITQETSKEVRVDENVRFKEGRMRGESTTSEEEKVVSELKTVKEEVANTILTENKNEEQVRTKARVFLSTMPELLKNMELNQNKEEESLDNQSECSVHSDSSLDNIHEISCSKLPFISTGHLLPAAETSKKQQIHEVAQCKQNLQRTEGVFNLTDNPDVLEIPFKSNLSLESLLANVCTSQPSRWQFSEKKMQKEINQEIQRELVLVNQGKIPGGYSRGEVRQLKETKKLFEAFQQDNTNVPTRHQKHPASVMKGDVYPSVLERTRSLEMFSLKTCSVSRTQSLRLNYSETTKSDKNLENFRTKSPTGGSREKTRLSPYSKQDKHLRLHRSMDSISSEASASAIKTRDKTREGSQDSPILKQNPFFKLRPAMALQPGVEKDIREAKEREEELRKQRCKLYGEFRQKSEEEEEKSRCTQTVGSGLLCVHTFIF